MITRPAEAGRHAAAFARWATDPANRAERPQDRRQRVHPRQVNDDLRAVAELLEFMAVNRHEAPEVLARLGVGPEPWSQLSDMHGTVWFRQLRRVPHSPALNPNHYVDDHALAQITAALPLLGLAREEQLLIRRGDGSQVRAPGFGDRRPCV